MRPFIAPRSSVKPTIKPAAGAVVLLTASMVLIVLVISQTGALHAQTPEPPYSESQAQGIDRMIMCPVCPAETIDQAEVEISFQMRKVVREMLSQGSSRDEILDFFVERYGKDILAAPPKSGANLVAWLLPVGGVGAALVAVFFIIRSSTRRGPVVATSQPVQDPGLIPYLELVDRHLEITRGGSRPGGTSNQPGPGVELPGIDSSDPTESSGRTDHPGAEESR